MNIFVTSLNPEISAINLCDKHVVKMVTETAQLLSTAIQVVNPNAEGLYRITHQNHPCTIWARESQSNFRWLVAHGLSLSEEYTYRYNKIHKSTSIISSASEYVDCLPKLDKTPFAQTMPDKFKHNNAVHAYRQFMIHFKVKNIDMRYSRRRPPAWLLSDESISAEEHIDNDIQSWRISYGTKGSGC